MGSGGWVEDVVQAHDFKFGVDAIGFALKNRLADVEVVYAFPDPQYNVSTQPIGSYTVAGHPVPLNGSALESRHS